MGQAKKRGTFEQRQAEAIERDRLERETYQQDMLRRQSALGNRQGKSRSQIMLAAGLISSLRAIEPK